MTNIDYLMNAHGMVLGASSGSAGNDAEMEKPIDSSVHSLVIERNNANPETGVRYTKQSINEIPAAGNDGFFYGGTWQEKFPFNQIKPCIMRNGAVVAYLDKNDFTKREDGTSVVTSDYDTGLNNPGLGDVMIEFPKMYWRIRHTETEIQIDLSQMKVNNEYTCPAFTKNGVEKDKIYLGAYLAGRNADGHMTSTYTNGGVTSPTVSLLMNEYRAAAALKGDGYQMMGYQHALMMQILFLFMFKNRNSQIALGIGRIGDGPRGMTSARGMHYGNTSDVSKVKFCGLEDIWGTKATLVDGIHLDADGLVWTGDHDFNDASDGYVNHGRVSEEYQYGYFGETSGLDALPFFPKRNGVLTGSTSTHYADYYTLRWGSNLCFGGTPTDRGFMGIFDIGSLDFGTTNSQVGSRLAFV